MLSAATILAQADDDSVIPTEAGQVIVWVAVAAVILWLYFTVRRSQRRASQAYWDRHKAEEELRRNDPDLRRDD